MERITIIIMESGQKKILVSGKKLWPTVVNAWDHINLQVVSSSNNKTASNACAILGRKKVIRIYVMKYVQF